MTKVTIDRPDCTSCTSCWNVCPEIFEEDPDDGLSRIIEKYRVGGDPGTGEVPSDLESCAQDAADDCPVSIITVSD